MSDHNIDVEALAKRMHDQMVEQDRDECRLLAFYETVGDLTGPVGELVREIALAYSGFQESAALGGTTEGEAERLGEVLRQAMTVSVWLRDGGQP